MLNSRVARAIGLLVALFVGTLDAPLAGQAAAAPATTPAPAAAPAATAPPAAETFSKEQLEQLVAPIALYADSLLSQILMASTYPLEIVEADRFMKKNPDLKGTALDEKLKAEDWDATVKALCTVPDVLSKMSENLDWTQDLGDAFLGQKTELMDTVQRMRGKAHDSGNLKTTEQQVVTVQQDKIIVIESPQPEVVYVPTYSPTVVYGGWSYPSYYYPPMYPYYPPGAGLVTFGVGMAMGAAIWGDCNWGWGGGDVNIDVDRYNNFNRNTNINADRTNLSGDRAGNRAGTTSGNRAGATSGNRASFQHDSSHRKGVNYKNSQTAGQYGAKSGSTRASSAEARGRSGASAGTRQAGTTGASSRGSGTRPSGTASGQAAGSRDRPTGGASSTGSRDRSGGGTPSASQRSSSGRSSSYSPGSSAYGGSSRSSASRASSSRGSASRGSRSYGGGGGGRGGGGRGGRS